MATKRVRKTVNAKQDGKILWKKIGGGSFPFGGKTIKQNQTFYAYPEEISNAFKDVIIPMEKIPVKEPDPSVFQLQEVEDGLFNIVDQDGKPLTQQPIEKEMAERMLEVL